MMKYDAQHARNIPNEMNTIYATFFSATNAFSLEHFFVESRELFRTTRYILMYITSISTETIQKTVPRQKWMYSFGRFLILHLSPEIS